MAIKASEVGQTAVNWVEEEKENVLLNYSG